MTDSRHVMQNIIDCTHITGKNSDYLYSFQKNLTDNSHITKNITDCSPAVAAVFLYIHNKLHGFKEYCA